VSAAVSWPGGGYRTCELGRIVSIANGLGISTSCSIFEAQPTIASSRQ
jgi:hypothetical protein